MGDWGSPHDIHRLFLAQDELFLAIVVFWMIDCPCMWPSRSCTRQVFYVTQSEFLDVINDELNALCIQSDA